MIVDGKTLDAPCRYPIATVLVIYILIAVATSHPLTTAPSEVLPGSNNSLLSAWITSWVERALPATSSTSSCGLDPLSWTPNPFGDRSPRCQSRETDTWASSGAKW